MAMFEDWNIKDPIRFDLKVSEELHDQRAETCKNCEKLNKLRFCDECGCFMPLKTWLKMSQCPLNKWPQSN